MKEKLYTIEVTDALGAGDECPFCFLERKLTEEAISFALGASYMESDIREETDKQGFCRSHGKMMYDYGNSLGNAWITKTRLQFLRAGLEKEMERYQPEKKSLFGRRGNGGDSSSLAAWLRNQEQGCCVCRRVDAAKKRMVDTFLYLIGKEEHFLQQVRESKGFCFPHFLELLEVCELALDEKEKKCLLPLIFSLMKDNLDRIQQDVNWLIEKYDYQNADADWKNSKDALQRTIQKINGGYPADPVFKART